MSMRSFESHVSAIKHQIWCSLHESGDYPYPEQFHTEKSFTALVSFTISSTYRISLENAKAEDLKEQERIRTGG